MIRDPFEHMRNGKPIRALRRWPAASKHIVAGLIQETPIDATRSLYSLTDRGRRKLAGYRMQAAGHGK